MRRFCFAALSALAVLCNEAPAQNYPVRPVRLIVPGVPGAPSDVVARQIATPLAVEIGQPVIVDNRPGAAGLIAAQEAARSPPDGYTLLYALNNNVLRDIAPNAKYTIDKSFVPITRTTLQAYIIVVHPSVQASSLADLIALAKARPGSLTYASGGPGGVTSLLGALLRTDAGIDMLEVPYKTLGAEFPNLLAGQVLIAFETGSVVAQQIRSGKLKALAATRGRRVAAFPDIPTTAEAGLPEVEVTAWGGILAPIGTPQSIIRLLHQRLTAAINTPTFKEHVMATGGEIGGDSPEEFAAFLNAESAKWSKLIKTAGVKLE